MKVEYVSCNGLQACDHQAMSDGIDHKRKTIDLMAMLPNPGDSALIVNCGTHFEVRYADGAELPLLLTDDDIEALQQGRITWH